MATFISNEEVIATDTSTRLKYLNKSESHDGKTWFNVQTPSLVTNVCK